MTEVIVISLVAFFTAVLTFFSGFGLGTILMPVFALFFPVDTAIALTGIVHFANNLFKAVLVGKKADKPVLFRFGVPAILASFAGAWLLLRLSELPALHRYEYWGREFEITVLKLIIAVLLMVFSLIEIMPRNRQVRFSKNSLIIGGTLSGFFGGLAGLQGALRSAFLIKSGLTKEEYIATGVIIALLVDITRLSVYASRFETSGLQGNTWVVASAIMAAMAGALAGKLLLHKVTFRFVQGLVAVMLMLISIALGTGLV